MARKHAKTDDLRPDPQPGRSQGPWGPSAAGKQAATDDFEGRSRAGALSTGAFWCAVALGLVTVELSRW